MQRVREVSVVQVGGRLNGFDLDIAVSLDRDHSLRVSGKRAPYFPARTNCRNEDAAPAEGGELEDLRVFVIRKRRDGRAIERQVKLKDERLIEHVEEQVQEELARC